MKNLKKVLLPSLAVMALLAGGLAAKADPLTVSFDEAFQSGYAGQTLTFSGTVVNTGADFENIDGDSIVLDPALLTDDGSGTFTGGFWNLGPLSMNPGDTSGDISLFTVFIPAGTPLGEYDGSFEVVGDSGPIGEGTFDVDVTPTPEPGSLLLLGTGLIAAAGMARRRLSR